jgi:hypothetical protein
VGCQNTGDGEGGDSESKKIENLADNIVGASAFNRRRLVRVFDAITVTHFLLLLVRIHCLNFHRSVLRAPAPCCLKSDLRALPLVVYNI